LKEDDIGEVVALEARAHAAPWTPGNFRDALAAGYATLVGERAGRIVAYGVLMLAPGEAQILNLTVAPDARGEGLGRRLLHHFVDHARAFGAEQIFLEVRSSNAAAVGLYQAEGFVPVARRAGYYPGPTADAAREDALVMRRGVARTNPDQ
jgi:ribosomal-protein-alanine N-acetyltransferase